MWVLIVFGGITRLRTFRRNIFIKTVQGGNDIPTSGDVDIRFAVSFQLSLYNPVHIFCFVAPFLHFFWFLVCSITLDLNRRVHACLAGDTHQYYNQTYLYRLPKRHKNISFSFMNRCLLHIGPNA